MTMLMGIKKPLQANNHLYKRMATGSCHVPTTIFLLVAVAAMIFAPTCCSGDDNFILYSRGAVLHSRKPMLGPGQSLSHGPYRLKMQVDCNLVLYKEEKPLWASNTVHADKTCWFFLDGDGGLTVLGMYKGNVWTSGKTGTSGGNYALILQSDGNLVVYGPALWTTGTAGMVAANMSASHVAGQATAAAAVAE